MRGNVPRLVETGRHREALNVLIGLRAPTLDEQLLRCELEASSGQRIEAYDAAKLLLLRELASTQRIRALLLLGKIDFYFGRSAAGHGHLKQAHVIATSSGDPHQLSLVLGAQVDCLFHFESFESGLAHLSEFRRFAIRSGRPSDLFALRTLLAEAELKAGRAHRAARELELAAVHSAGSANIVWEAQLEFVSGVVSIGLGQLSKAYEHTHRAVALASEAGATTIEEPSRNNLAHLQVVQGRYEAASKSINQLISPRPKSLDVELLRRATQLQLASETSSEETAEQIEKEFGAVAVERVSVHANWFNLARAAHMLRAGRVAEAHELSSLVLTRVSGGSDRDLLDRTRLVVAEALARAARPRDAISLLTEVALGPMGRVVELIAGIDRVAGYLCTDEQWPAEHFARAARALGQIGHVSGQREVLRELRSDNEIATTDDCRRAKWHKDRWSGHDRLESRSILERSGGCPRRRRAG